MTMELEMNPVPSKKEELKTLRERIREKAELIKLARQLNELTSGNDSGKDNKKGV